jgi:hypothetical protein
MGRSLSDGWCPNLKTPFKTALMTCAIYGLLPINSLMGASNVIPSPLLEKIPGHGICSNAQGSAERLSARKDMISAADAWKAFGSAPLRVPISIPFTVACPGPANTGWTIQPARERHSVTCRLIPETSAESPNVAMSITVPEKGRRVATRTFCCAGANTLSASRASNWSRASLSLSAISFADAARSFAFAISSRKPSAFWFASAACCSAEARLACALVARSFASAAPRFAVAISRSNPPASALASAASCWACAVFCRSPSNLNLKLSNSSDLIALIRLFTSSAPAPNMNVAAKRTTPPISKNDFNPSRDID